MLYCLKRIIQYAIPISVTNMINIIATFIATLLVARIGVSELAAMALAGTKYMMISTLGFASGFIIAIVLLWCEYKKSINALFVKNELINGEKLLKPE